MDNVLSRKPGPTLVPGVLDDWHSYQYGSWIQMTVGLSQLRQDLNLSKIKQRLKSGMDQVSPELRQFDRFLFDGAHGTHGTHVHMGHMGQKFYTHGAKIVQICFTQAYFIIFLLFGAIMFKDLHK